MTNVLKYYLIDIGIYGRYTIFKLSLQSNIINVFFLKHFILYLLYEIVVVNTEFKFSYSYQRTKL